MSCSPIPPPLSDSAVPTSPGAKSSIRQLKNRLSFRGKRPNRNHHDGIASSTALAGLSLEDMKLLSQTEALALDQDLYEEYRFTVDQISELAGLAVASAVAKAFPTASFGTRTKVLVICGPGNNGRDGLVCARHLKMFGYSPSIFYPKPSNNQLMKVLVHQIEACEISALSYLPVDPNLISHSYNLIVDAVFGINFVPPVRDPFVDILDRMKKVTVPIISVDIPSGWDVNKGPIDESNCLKPTALISLSAPKKCCATFKGRYHFLGGRFIPNSLAQKYELNLHGYAGADQIVEISSCID